MFPGKTEEINFILHYITGHSNYLEFVRKKNFEIKYSMDSPDILFMLNVGAMRKNIDDTLE